MYKDRKEAGTLLVEKLSQYKNDKDAIVLGIPRGGVGVGYEVAQKLNIPLDVVVIKKIGFPGNEEFGIGAVTVDSYYLNEDVLKTAVVPQNYIQEQIQQKQKEAKQRFDDLRGTKPTLDLKDKTVIVVDDGVATGATMATAIQVIKKQSPKKVIVAIPVAPPEAVHELEKVADEVICLSQPEFFMAIGQFYKNFPQLEDEQVKQYLQQRT